MNFRVRRSGHESQMAERSLANTTLTSLSCHFVKRRLGTKLISWSGHEGRHSPSIHTGFSPNPKKEKGSKEKIEKLEFGTVVKAPLGMRSLHLGVPEFESQLCSPF